MNRSRVVRFASEIRSNRGKICVAVAAFGFAPSSSNLFGLALNKRGKIKKEIKGQKERTWTSKECVLYYLLRIIHEQRLESKDFLIFPADWRGASPMMILENLAGFWWVIISFHEGTNWRTSRISFFLRRIDIAHLAVDWRRLVVILYKRFVAQRQRDELNWSLPNEFWREAASNRRACCLLSLASLRRRRLSAFTANSYGDFVRVRVIVHRRSLHVVHYRWLIIFHSVLLFTIF